MQKKVKNPTKTIYLDYAATTPIGPEVKKAMEPFLSGEFGNPSSLYQLGLRAKKAIDGSRKTIAGILNGKPNEIIFTAGGTEGCNLAIFGVARHYEQSHKRKGHIITTAIEHHAVLEPIEALKRDGWSVTSLKVNDEGFINLKDVEKAIRPNTVLISVMYANNEIGTVEPISQIGKLLRVVNSKRKQKIVFHTDACQAAGFLDLDVQKLGVDLLTANGSKIYGPKQSAFLYVRQGTVINPLIYGGGQERGLRSGTENVAGIIGLAAALARVQKKQDRENKRLIDLRDYFAAKILEKIPGTVLNGPWLWTDKKIRTKYLNRLPNNISISFDGLEGESLMLYLDSHGVAVTTGSACSTGKPDPSHVLKAIGRTDGQAKGTIRFSIGESTNKKDLDLALKILPKLVQQARKSK